MLRTAVRVATKAACGSKRAVAAGSFSGWGDIAPDGDGEGGEERAPRPLRREPREAPEGGRDYASRPRDEGFAPRRPVSRDGGGFSRGGGGYDRDAPRRDGGGYAGRGGFERRGPPEARPGECVLLSPSDGLA